MTGTISNITRLSEPRLIDLPKIPDPRGNLSFIENEAQIPFRIARCYWIYDVPGGEVRHGHAFHHATELIVALSGSFDIVVTAPDGSETTYHMARSYKGLLLPPMTWRRLDNFSTNSVAMVLSSTPYMPEDYIEDLGTYRSICKNGLSYYSPSIIPTACPGGDGHNHGTLDSKGLTGIDSHSTSRLGDCRIIELPRHRHANGSLTVVDNRCSIFNVKRVFYLYDVPGDSSRGGHSHREAQEIMTAASGSFDVTLSDGHDTRTFSLNRPYRGLYIPAGIWRNLDNFSSGAVSLVLTSELYSEHDYVRDYEVFKRLTADKVNLPV